MPRDGFWPQGYSLEQEEVPTLTELLFYWEIETNKRSSATVKDEGKKVRV